MSAGNPKVVVRIPPDLLAECELCIAQRNVFTRDEPWDFSKFVRVALREKLRKMARSRRRRPAAAKRADQPEIPSKVLDEDVTAD